LRPCASKASAVSLPPLPLRLLPAGAKVAGRDSHPLKSAALARRTRGRDSSRDARVASPSDFQGRSAIEFDAAVTMGCGDECPFIQAKRRVDWTIPDPKEMPPERFREVRDLIERQVQGLLREL